MLTYDEYVKEVRKHFTVGAKPVEEVDAFFKEKDTVDYLKDGYKYYSKEDMPEASPLAVASCLDLMY